MEQVINILIVDDEPKNLTVLESILDDPGYRLVRAASAEQALLTLVVEEFALLILDIGMPGMTGSELAQIIKERKKTARVPIIFLTAYYNEDQHVLAGYETGAVDYLHKPVNPAVLRSKVAIFAELHRKNGESVMAHRALLAEVTERRRAEEQLRELNDTLEQRVADRTKALRESEERFRTVVNQASTGVVQSDATGRMTLVNQRMCEMVGYSEAELLQMNIEDLADPDLLPQMQEAVRRLVEGGPDFIIETRLRRKDGSLLWASRNINALRSPAGEYLGRVGVVLDITERKQAEEAGARLAAIVESSEDAIISKGLDGVITSWNRGAERLFGYTAQEAIGQPVLMIIPTDLESEEPVIMERIRKGETIGHYETLRCGKNRTPVEVSLTVSPIKDTAGKIIGASKIARDITVRKRTDEALQRTEQELRDFVENATVGMHWVGADGIILWANRTELQLLGYSREEYIGHHIAEFHADEPVIQDILGRLTRDETLGDYEARLRCKDGSIRDVLINSNVLRENGKFVHTRCFTRDITERKRAEEALRESENRKSAILDSALDAIITMDHQGKVVDFNPAAESTFGIRPEEIIGQLLAEKIIPERLRLRHYQGLAHYLATGEGPVLRKRIEVPALHADGHEFPAELSVNRIAGIEPPMFTATLRDITDRKRAQEALRESQAALEFTLEAAQIGDWDLDLIHDTSRRSLRHDQCLGYNEPIPEKDWGFEVFIQHVHPEDRARVERDFREAVSELKDWQFECRVVWPDESVHWIAVHGSIYHAEDGKPVRMLGIISNITERKQAEEALLESRQRTTNIVESITDAFTTLDKEWRYTFLNQRAEEILLPLQKSRENLLGKSLWEEFPDLTGTVVEENYRRCMAEQVPVEFELFYPPLDGWFEVRAYPSKDGISSYFQDITERKKGEETLRATIDSALDCIITIDESDTIIEFNPAAEQTFGWSRADAIGRTLSETIIPPRSRAGHRHGMARLVADGQPRLIGKRIEITAMREGGAEFPIELTVVQIGTGRPALFTAFIRDITERNETQIALRKEREFLAAVVDNVSDGIVSCDANGVIALFNAATREFHGLPAEPIAADEWAEYFDLYLPDGKTLMRKEQIPLFRALEEGFVQNAEMVIAPREGTPRRILASGQAFFNEQGEKIGAVVAMHDVTERKQAEEELRTSEERFRSLVSIITDVPWTTDAQGAFAGPQLAWEKFTGQSWEEHRGFGWVNAVHPEDRESVKEIWEAAHRTRSLYEARGRLWHAPSQQYRHFVARAAPLFDANGDVRAWVGACTDSHDAEALRESEERFRTAVGAVSDLIWTNNAEGKMEGEQPGWSAFTGQRREEYEGYGWSKAVHPEDAQPTIDAWNQAVAEKRTFEFEHRVRRRDGEWRLCSIRAVPVRGARGEIREWVGVHTDITERKQTEEQIRRLNAGLEQRVVERTAALEMEVAAHRVAEERVRQLNDQLNGRVAELADTNAELESFSYTVSHDLRAPLRHIGGFTRLLAAGAEGKLDADTAEYLPRIADAATRMGQLIDALLDFSRLGRAGLRPTGVNLEKLIGEIRAHLQPDLEGRALEWKIGPLPVVRADPAMLRQVLANLLDNAVKFTRTQPAAVIEITCESRPEEHVLCIRDNGAGFDPRYADKLFGVFQRLHSGKEFEGTGIGLATTRRIIHRHGGRTWAESQPGQGASFFFSLPKN